MELAFIDRRESDAVELFSVESKFGGDGRQLAVGVGSKGVGIVGDVGLVDPVGALLLVGKIGELMLGVIEELLCLLGRGRSRRGIRVRVPLRALSGVALCGECYCQEWKQSERQGSDQR